MALPAQVCRQEISLLDALTGFRTGFRHLDGRVLSLACDAEVTQVREDLPAEALCMMCRADALSPRASSSALSLSSLSPSSALSLSSALSALKARRLASRPPGQPGQLRRIRGCGMPRPRGTGKGDLFLRMSVRFPRDPLAAEASRQLKQLLPRAANAGAARAPPPTPGERVYAMESVREEQEEAGAEAEFAF